MSNKKKILIIQKVHEKGMELYKKVRKLGFVGKIKYLLFGKTDKK